ncbi:hypothetical protein SYNPS1DRAFT_29835 [Syncephalis pseudoplumigaleata]|uniref:GDSL lipase/esterase n=1 Tax=Syncephalis pseudoplumigaleata TaxID=1712513 RepID=A0A4P9YWK3_9FUNG|nr:hypothetical protein SYNPS1DRAFT_29835 [Syncephalis pseudoplumigaleata]|eukprot:RKP24397.1 hypothetical protein SYNPS1DRAFT_29835 [Syncephalis pseudoplumigaleata]
MSRSLVVFVLASAVYTAATPVANSFNLQAYHRAVILGNSVSDTGRVYEATGHQIPDPKYFYQGRFTNGPNWVDQLEAKYHIAVNNYAFGGATSSNNVVPAETPLSKNLLIPSTQDQAELFYKPAVDKDGLPTPDTLHFLEVANNNYIYTEGEQKPVNATLIDAGVRSILGTVDYLHRTLKATSVLVFGVPALEVTPHFLGLPQQFQRETAHITTEHNRLLLAALEAYQKQYPAVRLFFFDFKQTMERVIKDRAAYGFTDVTTACYNEKTGAVCTNADAHLFWDHIHPTTKGHAALLQGVVDSAFAVGGSGKAR